MILYQIQISQPECLLREEVSLNVSVVNQGSETVNVPSPEAAKNSMPFFAISGPAFAQTRTFSNWSATHPEGSEPPPNQEIALAPGETWTGVLPLTSLLPLRVPGDYRIGSVLVAGAEQARSPDQAFRVSALDPSSIDLGTGLRPQDVGVGSIVFLQRGRDTATLYATRFDELDPTNSELVIASLVRRVQVSPDATDVSSPHRNTPFFDEFLQWIVWREGRTLKVLNTAASVPGSFDFPTDIASLVRPTLKTKNGPVEVLALSADRRQLLLVTIPPVLHSKPTLAWQTELPGLPAYVTAALGPVEKGNTRHIALAIPREAGFDILTATYRDGQRPGPFQVTHVERGKLLPNNPLTMSVTGDDAAHVAVVVQTGEKQYAIVEITSDAHPATPLVTPVRGEFGRVTASSVLYTVKEGELVRSTTLLLADGALRNVDQHGLPHSLPSRVRPLVPLLVTSGKDRDYLLCSARDGSLYFQPL